MSEITLPDIHLKHGAKTIVYKQNLKKSMIEEIKKIPDLSELHLDEEITKWVTNILENAIDKKDLIDKKKLAIEIISEAFGLNAQDQKRLSKQIDFIFNNHMIKNKYFRLLFKTTIKIITAGFLKV